MNAANMKRIGQRAGQALAGVGARWLRVKPAPARGTGVPPVLPLALSRGLARILRPQAAYRWLLPQLAAITPEYIEMTLRGAMAGSHVQAWELFDLMEDSSPRLLKNLNEVKRAVVGMDWKLCPYQEAEEPPSAAAKAKAQLVSAALRRMRPDPAADENDFSGTVYDVLDAWAKGQTVLEVDWELRPLGTLGQAIAPRATYWVHPTCYAWTMAGRLGLRLELTQNLPRPGQRSTTCPPELQRRGIHSPTINSLNYQLSPGTWQSTTLQPLPSAVADFPPHKFLISLCKAKSGTALGGALLRPLAWWWCAANFSGDWLMKLAELFGMPLRWVNYPASAPQASIDSLCAMLENMGSNAWAAFPAGVEVQFAERESRLKGENSPQGDLLDRAEKQMDLLILGQTLTTDVSKQGGSRALGEVHAGVRSEIVQAAGNFAATVLNTQLIRSLLLLNYGEDSEAPEFRPAPKEREDVAANARRDATLFEAGVAMPKAWFYQRHDIPLPQAGEETIGGGGAKGGTGLAGAADGNPKSEGPKSEGNPKPDRSSVGSAEEEAPGSEGDPITNH